jgi:hypothetical protein
VGAIRFSAGALGLALDVIGSAAWGVAAFFIVNSLISTAAGGLLGLGIFLSSLTLVLNGRLQESRARALQADTCPRCKMGLRREHEHRRWDTERERWLAPLTTWDCSACGFGHSEPVPCIRCPEAA